MGADGTVVVPVNIDDPRPAGSTGLVEADLALTYNPSLFTVSASDVHAGSVLAGGNWSVVPTIDQATGQIGIALLGSTPISSATGGSLVTIDFHPTRARVRARPSSTWSQSVTPNGQYVMTELADTHGLFTLTPAPTNGFNPRIDGVVFLTATPATASVSSSLITEARASTASSTSKPRVPTTGRPKCSRPQLPNQPAPAVESSAQDVGGSNPAAEVAPFHGGSNLHGVAGGNPRQRRHVCGRAADGPGLPGNRQSGARRPVRRGHGRGAIPGRPALPGAGAGYEHPDRSDPGGPAKEALERVLAHQLLHLPLAADDLEDLNWNDSDEWDGLPKSPCANQQLNV